SRHGIGRDSPRRPFGGVLRRPSQAPRRRHEDPARRSAGGPDSTRSPGAPLDSRYPRSGEGPVTRAVMSFLPLFALLVAAFAAPAHAAADKGAENVYHPAAALYVEGKLQNASVEAEEGLRRYPDDPRLRMLVEQLRKMKDEQRGGGK